jgi:hypothetical protein
MSESSNKHGRGLKPSVKAILPCVELHSNPRFMGAEAPGPPSEDRFVKGPPTSSASKSRSYTSTTNESTMFVIPDTAKMFSDGHTATSWMLMPGLDNETGTTISAMLRKYKL